MLIGKFKVFVIVGLGIVIWMFNVFVFMFLLVGCGYGLNLVMFFVLFNILLLIWMLVRFSEEYIVVLGFGFVFVSNFWGVLVKIILLL